LAEIRRNTQPSASIQSAQLFSVHKREWILVIPGEYLKSERYAADMFTGEETGGEHAKGF
jgi:hypothetical protein